MIGTRDHQCGSARIGSSSVRVENGSGNDAMHRPAGSGVDDVRIAHTLILVVALVVPGGMHALAVAKLQGGNHPFALGVADTGPPGSVSVPAARGHTAAEAEQGIVDPHAP